MIIDGARSAYDELLRSFLVPVTHQHWEAWLHANLDAFRASMLTAPADRKQRNRRVRARENLPQAVGRIQPLALTTCKCVTDWARKLQNRTGWHGIHTKKHGTIVVFLIHLNFVTHYVRGRITHAWPPQCTLRSDFKVTECVFGLDHLEAMLAGDLVLELFRFDVTAEAAISVGVRINLVGQRELPPVVARRRKAGDAAEDEELVELGSDVEDDVEPMVDTDVESDAGSESSDASSVDLKAETIKQFRVLHPAPVMQPRAKAIATGDARRPPTAALWSYDYFVVRHRRKDSTIQVRTKDAHVDTLVGKWPMSCQVKPRDFGEKLDDPVRSTLVFRGWVLWRVHVEKWADNRRCRAKHFVDFETCLERDVKSLNAPCGLLGDVNANRQFMSFVPLLAARLLRAG